MTNNKYNISVLIEAVNDYFYAEQELKTFLKTWTPGWLESKPAKKRENYAKYTERSQEKSNAVYLLCRLININAETLFAMVKSMNRYERRMKWQICVHITYRNEENVGRFLAKNNADYYHYNSTGRRRMYAECRG